MQRPYRANYKDRASWLIAWKISIDHETQKYIHELERDDDE
jgi:hypothetical protein